MEVEVPGGGGGVHGALLPALHVEGRVALKVLKAELAAMIGAGRSVAEIKTTPNLQHPHIRPLFDSGEADGFALHPGRVTPRPVGP